jgi:hypothetical protein
MGTTGTPGQNSAVSFSIGAIIAGVSGGGAAVGPRVSSVVTLTSGSATSSSSFARTVSAGVPGKMRQFTVARARCGSAFEAWPASSSVATHVVRSVAFQLGSLLETSAIAFSSLGSRRNAFIAFAMSVSPFDPFSFVMAVKYARLASLNSAGKSYAPIRMSAPAR